MARMLIFGYLVRSRCVQVVSGDGVISLRNGAVTSRGRKEFFWDGSRYFRAVKFGYMVQSGFS